MWIGENYNTNTHTITSWRNGDMQFPNDVALGGAPPSLPPASLYAVDAVTLLVTGVASGNTAALTAAQRAYAIALLTSTDPAAKALRAIMLGLIDTTVGELNLLREWVESFKTAVAGAASLAALKTAVAALPAMPDRTLSGAVTAVKAAAVSHVNDGSADNGG